MSHNLFPGMMGGLPVLASFAPLREDPLSPLELKRLLTHSKQRGAKRNGTLYVGVTSDLIKRIWQHKNNVVKGFTERYSVHQLVWYELHETMESAIGKEKMLKNWKRVWKLELIERSNPNWQDLYGTIV